MTNYHVHIYRSGPSLFSSVYEEAGLAPLYTWYPHWRFTDVVNMSSLPCLSLGTLSFLASRLIPVLCKPGASMIGDGIPLCNPILASTHFDEVVTGSFGSTDKTE